jgi:outer membrane protein
MRLAGCVPSFFLALVCLPLAAAEPVSIGYVDMQRVIEESKLGKQAFATLQDKYAEPQAILQKEEKEIMQLQQNLARDGALMSQSELDKRKAALQERISQIQRKAAMAQQELSQDQAKLGSGIIKPAQEIIVELGKERKLTAIFERTQSGMLYVEEDRNLTNEVIKRLDAKTAKEAKEAKDAKPAKAK